MNNKTVKRAVAIVGRPNVGKSSIFNRLGGRRIAIVHEDCGVTRDRLVQEIKWGDQRFDLIDTGGLGRLADIKDDTNLDHNEIEAGVRHQVEMAVEDAAVIIFVTDIETGVLPQDEEAGTFLRKSGKPVFIAANKADTTERDSCALDFELLGFPVFPVSAIHGRGFEPLMKAIFQKLPEENNLTVEHPLKVTIVGRPNVGKSSFINRLLNSERVMTSDIPGTTRDSIDIPFVIGKDAMARHYILTDTAGIRRKGKIRSMVEHLSMSRADQSIARADVAMLILDAVQGPTSQDKKIASMILRYHKGCVILANKWDILHGFTSKQYLTAMNKAFPFLNFVPMLIGSAKTGFNMRRTIETIDAVAAHTQAQLPTHILNRAIEEFQKLVQPPLIRKKRFKIYYATQVDTQPVTIALFVNDPERLVPGYERSLSRELRGVFGLEGAPICFHLRKRRATSKS